jgi:hypothetical protein
MSSEEDAENRLIDRGMLLVLQRSTNNLRKLETNLSLRKKHNFYVFNLQLLLFSECSTRFFIKR